MAWKNAIGEKARVALAHAEDVADTTRHRLARRLGFGAPRHIAAYRGYGNGKRVWLRGRLLASRPYGGPNEGDGWWNNLVASWRRWHSWEVPGEPVTLSYGGFAQTVVTDREGYYTAEFGLDGDPATPAAVTATFKEPGRTLTATHQIVLPDPAASFMLISDVDDTIIHTYLTDLLLAARLTFLRNARTRKPLTGAAGLYRALAAHAGAAGVNPVFYLSNSGWNLYDLLRDFLTLNDFPPGPLLLRDLGFRTDTSNHKIETLHELFDRFAPLPAVLIGDSGQHDAEIYARIAETHPGRIRAIYIRDVDPLGNSDHDARIDRILERAELGGIPFLRVADSAQIARHAAEIGLLDAAAVQTVEADTGVDSLRQEQ